MILRRPYAFLIKNFKLLHILITIIFGYIAYNNTKIYEYINSVITDMVYKYDALSYINYSIYIWIILGCILCFIVYWLLKYKEKPRKLYLLLIGGYIIVSIFMLILFNYMNGITTGILEQKNIRAYRDIMLITLLFQYLMVISMFIRGLGFNLKKFNFDKDMQELNLTQADNEEVEVNLNVDMTNIIRRVRSEKRKFGYYFQEYKIFIMGVLSIIGVLLFVFFYGSLSKWLKVYKENDIIGINEVLTIKESYYMIDNNKNYIVLKFDISKGGRREEFNLNKLILKVDGKNYSPNKNVCSKFYKLGNCYKKQLITNDWKTYLVAYSIDELDTKRSYLIYNENYDNNYKVKLALENYE